MNVQTDRQTTDDLTDLSNARVNQKQITFYFFKVEKKFKTKFFLGLKKGTMPIPGMEDTKLVFLLRRH